MPDPLPGPYGKSWFELELDTTTPVLSWGSIPAFIPSGDWLEVPFTVNEPGFITATLRDSQGEDRIVEVTQNSLRIFIESGFAPGTATLLVQVSDEVGNQDEYAIFVDLRTSGGLEVGGGHAFTHGPILRRGPSRPFEQRIPGGVSLARETEISVVGAIRFAYPESSFESAFQGSVRVSKKFEKTFSGTRLNSPRLGKILQEDEEVLLTLL